MTLRFRILSILWAMLLPLKASESVCMDSPDKKMVAAWVDSSLGKALPDIRSIVIARNGDQGSVFFSKVTTPRSTQAAWSPDSRTCLIYDAPDNGNVFFWLVTAGKSPEDRWRGKEIHPMDPLYAVYEKKRAAKHWDATLWRPYCSEIKWIDNGTISMTAADNDGEYHLTVKLTDPDHPTITMVKAR